MFANYSNGVKTQRDAWCYNASKSAVADNMTRMIAFYNAEVDRFSKVHANFSRAQRESKLDDFVNADATKISWTHNIKQELEKDRRLEFDKACLVPSLYRPFNKQWLYYSRRLNERVYQMPRIFPDATSENIVIGVSGSESRSAYSVFITNVVPSLHAVDMVGSQYFPLYLYDPADDEAAASESEPELLESRVGQPLPRKRREALTDEGLAHFKAAYPEERITKEDVFYYVYGLLHSPDYRTHYADNLGKELPRIPCVKNVAGFRAFSQAGRDLAELHLNYEKVAKYPARIDSGSVPLTDDDYRVEKMRYGMKGGKKELSTVVYNSRITVHGIPPQAYEYVVNGKPAIDWVIERQCVKTDKASGIVNDANDWAAETMKNLRYPLELLLRVVTVSLETMKIVEALPRMEL